MKSLHDRVTNDLRTARESLGHPVALGDGSEAVWGKLFESYLPKRYRTERGTIVDSRGSFSEQIDVVIFDRQYSPFILNFNGQLVIPAEAVYAVFEAKQVATRPNVSYAQRKAASVRRLYRTSVDVETIDGKRKGKIPQNIICGFLAFDCRWKRPFGKTLTRVLDIDQTDGRLDLGCIAAHGTFGCGTGNCRSFNHDTKCVTTFLLELMSRLQECGTVPAMDFRAYAKWLNRT
jgi:hypothetical protein